MSNQTFAVELKAGMRTFFTGTAPVWQTEAGPWSTRCC